MTSMKIHHHCSNVMSDIASTASLNGAMDHVYRKRRKEGPNSDIWETHLHWPTYRAKIQQQLLAGHYALSPVDVYIADGHAVTRWSSLDSIVLKAIATALDPIVSQVVGKTCTHVKGHGGLKGAINQVNQQITKYTHVVRSDVAKYYHSMTVENVLAVCREDILDKRILALIQQLIERVEVFQGHYTLCEQGIPKGCALSPLIGALMLKSLGNNALKDCFIVRYMDDWVILTKTKRQCRRAVKWMHQVMRQHGFKLGVPISKLVTLWRWWDTVG